jgi:hypothetical protein
MNNMKLDDAPTIQDDLFSDTPIGILRSMQAFMRDLPALLANSKYDRCCVCYSGDERIGIAESDIDLLRECKRRDMAPDQY